MSEEMIQTEDFENSMKNYEKIKEEIFEEEKKRTLKDKANKECLKQIEIIEKAKANVLKEEQKLLKLIQKREAL